MCYYCSVNTISMPELMTTRVCISLSSQSEEYRQEHQVYWMYVDERV